jgi:glutamate synthase (NADPH/NADH)
MIVSSEAGVLPDIAPQDVVQKGRLSPGKMIWADFKKGCIIEDATLKKEFSEAKPFGDWIKSSGMTLQDLRKDRTEMKQTIKSSSESVVSSGGALGHADPTASFLAAGNIQSSNQGNRVPNLRAFGYTQESLDLLLLPMGTSGEEGLGSMGNDAPLACFSAQPRSCSDFFYQLFAQVTNPPIDPIRESMVMSVATWIGPEQNLLGEASASHCHRLWLDHPCLLPEDLETFKYASKDLRLKVLDATFPKAEGPSGLRKHLARICDEAVQAVTDGSSYLVLSDRAVSEHRVHLPALMCCGAVHQRLVHEKRRVQVGLIVDSGETHEVHHHAMLLTFGADAICPYMAYEGLLKLRADGKLEGEWTDAKLSANYQKSVGKGLLKIFAKMGISTLASYKGAQIADAIGLSKEVVMMCFQGISSQLGGLCFEQLADRALQWHERGYPSSGHSAAGYLFTTLPTEGQYNWRQGADAEKHINDPMVIAKLQEAARTNSRGAYAQFASLHNNLVKATSLRGQWDFKMPRQYGSTAVPLDAVEPASEIVKRFRTGAMSYGSISLEAHATLALAMNRMGGYSNTGEGGEDPIRYGKLPNGDSMKSAIKQVASGRFGVNVEYLSNAEEIQIKMAQGAKPGEGGELPGKKVLDNIAKTRCSTPGVGLISPPPHHDIYSIEDLAQLIFDLKNANPSADVSVKLVSETGVGVVAAGVAKCKADHILISGCDGGTGASKWTGIKHAGAPWELGLAETHQTLVLNGLRGRVTLETDGQLRTGRDVIIAALLGAERFGFATAPLIAMGCIMMRKCHLNTCPVGIATQDPILRKKFEGMPEHVANYLMLVAEEARTMMAKLGFREMDSLIGRADVLRVDPNQNSAPLHYLPILMPASRLPDAGKIGKIENRKLYQQDHFPVLMPLFDRKLVVAFAKTFRFGEASFAEFVGVRNTDRTMGTVLSHELYRRWGNTLEPATCHAVLKGTAGQSFGAFCMKGVFLQLEGDSQDFFGKGLSGGALAVYPPKQALDIGFKAEENVIIGNTALFGATSGVCFVRGIAAERFAVRNSGAWAVCEGAGDHCCEYMTGGRVVILGKTGENFGAGFSGGVVWIWDASKTFEKENPNIGPVEVSRLDAAKLHPVYPNDIEDLKLLLDKHKEFTGSSVAAQILERWPESAKEFVRVFPTDFQAAVKDAEDQGKDSPLQSIQALLPSPKKGETAEATPRAKHRRRMSSAEPMAASDGRMMLPTGAQASASMYLMSTDLEDIDAVMKGSRPKKVDNPHLVTKKTNGFVDFDRAELPKRKVDDRKMDFKEIGDKIDVEQIQTQAGRCMNCGTPFCHQSVTDRSGCPLGNLIPEWNELVLKGLWHQAFQRLMETNNFPEFTGRVCPAPCEGACVLGIIDDPVAIKSVELTIIDKAYEMGWMKPTPPPVRTQKNIAIIGSGPCGMAAADQLNKMGHTVTVYERADRVGGLMMYGVPNMKADKKNVVQRRVDIMAKEGITFITGKAGNIGSSQGDAMTDGGCSVAIAPTAQQLLDQSDAVILSAGATNARDLQSVPGRSANGVHLAMQFLTQNTKALLDGGDVGKGWRQWWGKNKDASSAGPIDAKGKNVIVIGGGDTGNDCIGTSVRHGAKRVINLEVMPKPPSERAGNNPWPHWPMVFKVDYGHEEAAPLIGGEDIREYGVSTKEFVTDAKGNLTGLRIVSVKWERANGQFRMAEVPGSERILEADLAFLALGFLGPEHPLGAAFGIDLDERGNYKARYDKAQGDFQTSNGKVFAAGDCRRGQSLVVWAIKEGRDCADEVNKFLTTGKAV